MCRLPRKRSVWDDCTYGGPCRDCVDVCRSDVGENDGPRPSPPPPPLETLEPRPEPGVSIIFFHVVDMSR